MRICPSAPEIRQIVQRAFRQLGIDDVELAEMAETVLVDEGRAMARSYRVAHLMAMWLIDVGIVQFYDDKGNMLRRVNLLAEVEPPTRRMAA